MAYDLHPPRHALPVRPALGFSLLELMVVTAIALALAALALPSWRSLLERWMLRTQAQALVDDLRYARTQALARAQPVSLCLSSQASQCASTSTGQSGWLVFLDPDGDRQLDPGESVLRQHQLDPQRLFVRSNHARAVLTYQSTGLARAAAQTLTLSASGGARRLICISLQGRPALQAEEAASCS
jgi:type IV fimbrial biogenesis protein FimT